MSDEQRPTTPESPQIRDPHAPVNLLRDFEPLDFPSTSGTSAGRPGAAASATSPRSLSEVADLDFSDTQDGLDISGASGQGPSSKRNIPGAARIDLRAAPTGPTTSDGPRSDDERLVARPRTSSRVLCVVLALLLFAAAAGAYWFGVRTETGQAFDDMVETNLAANLPGSLGTLLAAVTHLAVVAGSVAFAVVAAIVVIVRRRWWLLGQLVAFGLLCFAASFLKDVLPRPFIIHTQIDAANSAPSGHTLLAVAASLALALVVSRGWRWVAALAGGLWSAFVALSVVAGKWHRPSDVVMALALAGGAALLTLAFTRASGMDATGTRRSSAGVQVVGSIAITAGAFACLYAAYVIWQVVPGLLMSAQWARSGSTLAATILIVGTVALVFGLVLAMRQVTAAPLTKLGLVGAPPAPPKRR
ncbi:phosphatase PAP2 family protein [Bifidobacterium aesculapii]|uniref:phosphatase PAP2 family protein n=1 Tax=Bifidobacterium aesculapii TaxID=1329411 RepID=UPI0006E268BB|nr:phosphatase PAP2 family protein [Bifidobacterium aesculapii]